jgi:hypothetical protein
MATTEDPVPVTKEDSPPPGWGQDDGISFSKESGKYLKQIDDGSEMEWTPKLKLWLPVVTFPRNKR